MDSTFVHLPRRSATAGKYRMIKLSFSLGLFAMLASSNVRFRSEFFRFFSVVIWKNFYSSTGSRCRDRKMNILLNPQRSNWWLLQKTLLWLKLMADDAYTIFEKNHENQNNGLFQGDCTTLVDADADSSNLRTRWII